LATKLCHHKAFRRRATRYHRRRGWAADILGTNDVVDWETMVKDKAGVHGTGVLDGNGRDAILHDDWVQDLSAVFCDSGRAREAFRGVLRITRRVWTRGQTQIPPSHVFLFHFLP